LAPRLLRGSLGLATTFASALLLVAAGLAFADLSIALLLVCVDDDLALALTFPAVAFSDRVSMALGACEPVADSLALVLGFALVLSVVVETIDGMAVGVLDFPRVIMALGVGAGVCAFEGSAEVGVSATWFRSLIRVGVPSGARGSMTDSSPPY